MPEYRNLVEDDIIQDGDEANIWDKGHNHLSWQKVKPYIVGKIYAKYGHTMVSMRRLIKQKRFESVED